MARAVVATAYGGPEVLSLSEVEIGSPGSGRAQVEVRAAGVNPIDYKIYSGLMGSDPSKLPMRLGYEAAGVITAVDDGAEGPAGPLRAGDEVIAYPVQGAYASEIVAPVSSLVPKPQAMSFEQASGLMLTGVTAFHAITRAKLAKGDTVLVHGAAGGVGTMVVQLALDMAPVSSAPPAKAATPTCASSGPSPSITATASSTGPGAWPPTVSTPPSTRSGQTRRSMSPWPWSPTAPGW